ncbi:MAG: DeoR family transcriptional regulator [Gammaproteobacteria bacterium]|nr:DeoR family transcriptional regulator [Gammaproteobacteria bacterium]
MDRTKRFYSIEQMLPQRKVASFDDLMDELEVTRATVKRDLTYLRAQRSETLWLRLDSHVKTMILIITII